MIYALSGKLDNHENYCGAVEVDGVCLSEWVSELNLNGKVSLRYYFSDQEITEDRLVPDYLKTLYGSVECHYCPIYGSEWTGWYSDQEEFTFTATSGEHNLINEFYNYMGKYVWLEIEDEK